ncbi:MAG: NUDIX domain-containing protein [Thermoplasmata archaeon]|nr:NUDIX domain-containing protein [Thermoplasmata archaeon]
MAADLPPVAQECVEAYVFTLRPFQLLILRRPPSRESIWVPVSGKVEPIDPNYDAALRRELAEETGFTRFRRLFSLDWEVRFEGPNGAPWRLHAFGVELESRSSPRLSDEHVAFEWTTAESAIERLHYSDNQNAVRRLAERLHLPLSGAAAPTGTSP